ncbi:MAG: hypothetical protein WCG83_05240 [Candidatus Peregrinibacteria bacterium]
MSKIARLRDSEAQNLVTEDIELRILLLTQKYGAQALMMGDQRLRRVREAVANGGTDEVEAELGDYLDSYLDIGNITPQEIATAIDQGTHGFRHLYAPTARDVTNALQHDKSGISNNQFTANLGGTNEDIISGNATSGKTHIEEIGKRPIEKGRICDTWDVFWDLHFPEEVLVKLRQCDPGSTTLTIGLAFPVESFKCPETGRTDGRVVDFADKYEGPIGRKNAQAEAPISQLSKIPFAASLNAYLKNRTSKDFRKITIVPNDCTSGKVAFATMTGEKYEYNVNGTGTNKSAEDSDGNVFNPEMGHSDIYQASPADMVALALKGRTNFDTEVMISGAVLPLTFATMIRTAGGEHLYGRLPTDHGARSRLLFDLAYGRDPEILSSSTPAERMLLTTLARRILDRTEDSFARLLAADRLRDVIINFGEGSMLEDDFVAAVNRRIKDYAPIAGGHFLRKERPNVTFARTEDETEWGDKVTASALGNFQYGLGDDLLTQNV